MVRGFEAAERHTVVGGKRIIGLLKGSVQSLGNTWLDLVIRLPILGTH